MIRKLLLPLLSLAGIAFAMYTVALGERPIQVAAPAAQPALTPYRETIAGAGIVEAAGENVAIGTPVAGIVARVAVVENQSVSRGDVLFEIDAREASAEVRVREATLVSAQAELTRLQSMPRAEDLPPTLARLELAQAQSRESRLQLERAESIEDKRAMSDEELARRATNNLAAQARLSEISADLAKLRAGAWSADLEVARAGLAKARAQLEQAQTQLERLSVRAPTDGVVLQVNVRQGEFAPSGVLRDPLVLFGDLSMLHVRIDIDESEAWRLRAGSAARATVRGNASLSAELNFVRIEPFVVPKRSLTGDTSERVDTRVLQVIYGFAPSALPVYVGQQMDVFIDAAAPAERAK